MRRVTFTASFTESDEEAFPEGKQDVAKFVKLCIMSGDGASTGEIERITGLDLTSGGPPTISGIDVSSVCIEEVEQ